MSKKQESKTSSVLAKIGIGLLGVVGGLVLGKVIDEAIKSDEKPKAKVDPNQYTKDTDGYDNIQQLMTCPITNCIMKKPTIIIECGHTFEKDQIQKWIAKNGCCPLCKVRTSAESLKPNYQLEQIIAEYLKNRKQQREKNQKNQKIQAKIEQKPCAENDKK